jgi:predicted DCC family thiol-disulfide oxidoreductase YuxK
MPLMPETTVYYDGACPICSREVAQYQRARGAEGLRFVDASRCEAAALGPDLTRADALAAMHVRGPDGRLTRGARAFGVIWATLPAFRPLAWLMRLPGAGVAADLAYAGFLRLRPLWRR